MQDVVFDDAVHAGAATGRTGFKRLLAMAAERKFLLVEEVSRFSRDFLDGLATLGQLSKVGVKVADTKSGEINLGTHLGKLQAAFQLANGEAETQRLWNRTSRIGEKLPRTGKKQQLANARADWVEVEGFAPAIIEGDLWSRVQARLAVDAVKYKRSHTANAGRATYLLSGKLRCATCGASFSIGAHRGRPPVPYYRCNFAARGRSVCTNTTVVAQPALEAKVKQLLEVVMKDPTELKRLVSDHNRRIVATNEAQLVAVRTLRARHSSLTGEVERLVTAIALGKP